SSRRGERMHRKMTVPRLTLARDSHLPGRRAWRASGAGVLLTLALVLLPARAPAQASLPPMPGQEPQPAPQPRKEAPPALPGPKEAQPLMGYPCQPIPPVGLIITVGESVPYRPLTGKRIKRITSANPTRVRIDPIDANNPREASFTGLLPGLSKITIV